MLTYIIHPIWQNGRKVRIDDRKDERRRIMGRKPRIATPLSVAARTKRMLDAGRIKVEPVWYRPVINTPPMADFARKPAPAHQGRIRTKQTDLFELQQIARGAEQHYRRKF